jgi:purine-cytosine permease-like protein
MLTGASKGAKHFVNVPMGTGASEISSVMSFGTTIWAFQVSWGGFAADFAVYMREDTKPWKVFICTYSGLFIGGFFIEALGAALMTTVSGSKAFSDAYDLAGVGGILGQVFEGYGGGVRNFGYFIETILSTSVIAVVVTNLYALGLNVQMMSDSLIKVPRFIWSLIGGVIFLVAAIAGRNNLQAAMENFLNVIAYWLTPWLMIFFLEHIIWRRGYAYDVDAYTDPSRLPKGLAALVVFVIGTVIGILCMSQTW